MPAIHIQSLLFLVKIQIVSAVEGKTVPGAPFETLTCPPLVHTLAVILNIFLKKEKLERLTSTSYG